MITCKRGTVLATPAAVPASMALVFRWLSHEFHKTAVADALFGCVRAERVQVETAHGRLVTGERMAVLCRGSND